VHHAWEHLNMRILPGNKQAAAIARDKARQNPSTRRLSTSTRAHLLEWWAHLPEWWATLSYPIYQSGKPIYQSGEPIYQTGEHLFLPFPIYQSPSTKLVSTLLLSVPWWLRDLEHRGRPPPRCAVAAIRAAQLQYDMSLMQRQEHDLAKTAKAPHILRNSTPFSC